MGELDRLHVILGDSEALIKARNRDYIEQELVKYDSYFESLEKYPLTPKQREAIIVDEHRNLVIAGAGTGKTSTLVGKVGYLLEKKIVDPTHILLLSFGRDPKEEMEQRVLDKFGVSLDVNTFHSLGMRIIGEARGQRPTLTKLEDQVKLQKLIEDIIEKRKQDYSFLVAFNRFFLAKTEYRSLWEFKTMGEYHQYLRENEVRSLKGDLVRSFEELEIANFLFLNGLRYEYEQKYEYNTASKIHGQYTPDFYLTDYGVYIEHFGVDRKGNTAPCVPKKRYLEEMEWKRKLHHKKGTKLVETFSYEKTEGTLLTGLETKLKRKGVFYNKIREEDIFERLNDLGYIQPITQLISTFINLHKSSGLTISELETKAETHSNPNRAKAFIEIYKPILEDYQKHLAEQGEIDFNDMINISTEYLETGKANLSYSYILVDEFQDISQSRVRLLKAILNQNSECKLFSVGDDWQSIYRFAGSDLNIMIRFHEYFGDYEKYFLDETFRFNNQICDFSTKFILKNPRQIPKKLTTHTHVEEPRVSLLQSDNYGVTINGVLNELDNLGGSVFIIGRYRHNNPHSKKHPNLSINYLTAHKSKGTQADYVILTGLEAGKHGFPCEISDDPLLNLVLAEDDTYPHSEERRLFYVAVTRAKKHVYLLYNPKKPSVFIKEILSEQYPIKSYIGKTFSSGICPRCHGEITKIKGDSEFYACSNYPYCDYKAPSCPECKEGYMINSGLEYVCNTCGHEALRCPECSEGFEVSRTGYSRFWGCSNYPECQHKRTIPAIR
ncbi:helicase IV [Candidatus Bathyarchaeota archaeon]|nr:MAG: helicase IV [Candidatus Bathyarchaeota archaeon]